MFITPSTYKPDQPCIIEQAAAFVEYTKTEKLRCQILMHDNDGKYSKPFLQSLKSAKIKVYCTAIQSPNTVAFVECFVQTIEQGWLDYFIVFGHKHMDVLCKEFSEHYHLERPHQGLENELIKNPSKKKCKQSSVKANTIRLSDIQCHERLGGLLESYSRKAV